MNRLVTIRYSHYCEKARWALERARIEFVEEPHVPIISWIGTLGNRGNRTAPVFVANGKTYSESTDILRYADTHGSADKLFPKDDAEVARLEERYDRYLGPTARRAVYDDVLRLPRAQLAELLGKDAPRWEQRAARIATPFFGGMIRRGLRVTPNEVERSKKMVETIFAEVEALLKDGRRYLTGDAFTAADLTFAALASVIVFPDGYARYALPLAELPSNIKDIVHRHRDRPAGRFILRMYAEHRDAV